MTKSVRSRAKAGAVAPSPRTRPSPRRPPVRRPPERRPEPRRRPPRREHPWRPKPRPKPDPKPEPKEPRQPLPKPKPKPKPRPKPRPKPTPKLPKPKWKSFPAFPRPRLNPRILAPLLGGAGALIGWKNGDPEWDLAKFGFQKCCEVPLRLEAYTQGKVTFTCGSNSGKLCGTGGQPFTGLWPPPHIGPTTETRDGWIVRIGQIDTNPARCTWSQIWIRPGRKTSLPPYPVPYPDIPQLPVVYPDLPPMPWEPPLPLRPEPLPHYPRIKPRPRPKPDPDNPKPRRPPRRDEPRVSFPEIDVPSIDIGPKVEPGFHRKEPPDYPDKEKKKRLSQGDSRRWIKLLAQFKAMGGGITEFDDFIRALYDAIPYQLRRWRGRDGVWRERDATTAARAERIWQYLGRVSITTAIANLAKNAATDKIIGSLNSAIRDKNIENGFERGPTISRAAGTDEDWWEARKKEEIAQFRAWWNSRVPPDGRKWYTKRVKDPRTGLWKTVRIMRPVTQIPWYKQRSEINRTLPIYKDGKIVGYRNVPRWYYAANASRFPDGI